MNLNPSTLHIPKPSYAGTSDETLSPSTVDQVLTLPSPIWDGNFSTCLAETMKRKVANMENVVFQF